MKRFVYIALSVLLGVMITTIIHAVVEVAYISLLLSDFETFGLGLSWKSWELVHGMWSAVLLVVGVRLGYWLGVRWWDIVYVQKRHWLFRKNAR